MNAYVVRTKDARSYVEPLLEDGSGPSFPYLPIAPVVAETPGKAKALFLREFTSSPYSGVYDDDWPDLRCRLLFKDVDEEPGVYEQMRSDDDPFWLRIHELDDHGGNPCDCPSEESG